MSDAAKADDAGQPLPEIHTRLGDDEVLERLSRMARRGRLAGFARGGFGRHGGLFTADAMGTYFDRVLVAEAHTDSSGTTLRFRTVLPMRMPLIVAIICILTVWPGVWMTDSMLVTYWGWYAERVGEWPWLTYAWYLPLAALPLPFAYKAALDRSNEAADACARERIAAIAGELDGRVAAADGNCERPGK